MLGYLSFVIKSIKFRIIHSSIRRANKIRVLDSKLIIRGRSKIFGDLLLLNGGTLIIEENVGVSKTARLEVAGSKALMCLGKNVVIGDYSIVGTTSKITIEKNVTTSRNFNCGGDVFIGADTLIGPNVFISSGKHHIEGREKIRDLDSKYFNESGTHFSDEISIGADSWLGANVVILPGVKLGEGCVVAANSVVTKSFEDFSIIGGVPAKLLKVR
jgi:acetyltransferase-like isoleucine patch superfamily enzyme